ncbi:ATP-binding protein [Butyrivibrio sp. M55]|uniref:ATP-binding protein n=1 Tax=Butyrivibrio sp. M55 TaxID=1855323 RepID=UPI0008E01432|nr:ATP-binding protein [Butyrivibrio sp. M55]SFU70093.1 ATP-dependent DNA helicase RecG [Butyrivibrio sp. M55]
MRQESKYIEYKETVTKTFLKVVSAFANYNDGKIIFGICDDGSIKGLENPHKAAIDIENAINDSISPVPEYDITVNEHNKTVILNILRGSETPYFYHGKAYRRADTASVPVDTVELKRLVLRGTNRDYEELSAENQDLSFSILEKELKNMLKIDVFDRNILKTLGLYVEGSGYTIAAELLADENQYRGIDIIRFGESENQIMDRETFEHESLIAEYNAAIQVYKKYYQYDEIKEAKRNTVEMVPETAFREALANAIVHRMWDIQASVQIAMYKDKIQITSPGGLPEDISEDEYLYSQVSVLRNPRLADVFYKLNYIEKFGTGIRRITDAYKNERCKPEFSFTEHTICVTLPVKIRIQTDDMSEIVMQALVGSDGMTRRELEKLTGIKKASLIRILNSLLDEKLIEKTGTARNTKYFAK